MSTVKFFPAVVASLIAVALAAPAPASAIQTPGPCLPLETQSWWTPAEDGPLPAPGAMQHVHAGACFPYKQVVSGNYVLAVTVKMHNEAGRYLTHVRIDDSTDQDSDHRYSRTVNGLCASTDCTFVVELTVPTDTLPAGMHEWRVAASTAPNTGSGTQQNRNLATSGWQVCIRSCSGRTPAIDRLEARGWYMNEDTSFHEGYNTVRWTQDSEFPWDPATGAYRPVSGTWTPPLSLNLGAHDAPMVIDRSRCWVDPDFHNGLSGTTVLDRAGSFNGRLSIDTTRLANGLHKLACATGSSTEGFLDGVFVIPFQVQNATLPPPDTVIDSVITGEGFTISATFHGIWQTANGGSFECAVFYWTAYEPCSSPWFRNLPIPEASGSRTAVVVRAVEQGRVDPTPAIRLVTIP